LDREIPHSCCRSLKELMAIFTGLFKLVDHTLANRVALPR
jgi:hypothetical protein